MTDKKAIEEVINSVAYLRELKQWERLSKYFVKKPFVDDRAISGEMPTNLPKERLISNWRREIGSFFYASRHFVKRLAIRLVNSRRAKASAAVEYVHYVADRGQRYAWTVRGTVDYILVKTGEDRWKISQLIFRLQDQAVRPIGAAA